jgi:hypothetical protein
MGWHALVTADGACIIEVLELIGYPVPPVLIEKSQSMSSLSLSLSLSLSRSLSQ